MEEFRLNEGYKHNSVGCVSFSLENPAAVHEFPYGALLDKKLSNIITAGRQVSADDFAWELARLYPAAPLPARRRVPPALLQ
jgi:hypothetical protein